MALELVVFEKADIVDSLRRRESDHNEGDFTVEPYTLMRARLS